VAALTLLQRFLQCAADACVASDEARALVELWQRQEHNVGHTAAMAQACLESLRPLPQHTLVCMAAVLRHTFPAAAYVLPWTLHWAHLILNPHENTGTQFAMDIELSLRLREEKAGAVGEVLTGTELDDAIAAVVWAIKGQTAVPADLKTANITQLAVVAALLVAVKVPQVGVETRLCLRVGGGEASRRVVDAFVLHDSDTAAAADLPLPAVEFAPAAEEVQGQGERALAGKAPEPQAQPQPELQQGRQRGSFVENHAVRLAGYDGGSSDEEEEGDYDELRPEDRGLVVVVASEVVSL
jgi:hypothetical protein